MYAVFCGVHIAVLLGVAALFIMCIRKTSSPSKLSFMLMCFSLFILVLGMYLEMVDCSTTQEAIMALKMQYVALYPFTLSLLHFTSGMGGFRVPLWLWAILSVADTASFIAIVTTGTTQETDHRLFYSSMRMKNDGIYSRIVVGRGIFWYVTYAVVLFILIYTVVQLIISLKRHNSGIQRRRISLTLVGILAMGVEALMKMAGLFGSYNPFSFGAFAMLVFLYMALIRYGYFYSVASAPANLLDSGDEGAVMLDEHCTLIYMNATAKRILPELSGAKSAMEHPIIKKALSGTGSSVTIDGNVYEIRSERIQEFSSPCGWVIWLINMTQYQQRLNEINAASAAKSEFLARMSHEIRTPINTILGLNEMVMRTSHDKEVLEYSADIADAGDTLLTLVNDILDISRAESGKLTIEKEEYDTLELLRDVRLLTVQKAEERGLDMEFTTNPNLPKRLIGDPARIKQMAVNLLTNAVKYTQHGYVNLYAEMDGSDLVIAVSDSGVGIREDELPLIFNTFERIGAKGDGSGLGLTITKNIAESMGGTITVESRYGKGSVFTLRIPQEVVDGTSAGAFMPGTGRLPRQDEAHFVCPGLRILAVDDNRYNRLVLEKLLQRTKAKVTTAASGAEMLRLAREQEFDVLLLDAMMPEMDGVEALRRLRSDAESKCRDIPAAVLTADAVVGASDRYIHEGFDAYLAKPIVPEQLERLLMKLSGRGAEEAPAPAGRENSGEAAGLIDAAKGLQYSDNDPEFYRELLIMFTEEVPKALERLTDALSEGNTALYTTLVHGLKNNARGIGADRAADICYKAEQTARAGDLEALKQLHHEVCDEVRAAAEAAVVCC